MRPRVKTDSGMTLSELLVAMVIFSVFSGIVATFLISSTGFMRDLSFSAQNENAGVRFNEDFTTAVSSARAVRQVGKTGSLSPFRQNIRFDFAGPENECLTYEVAATTGKPTDEFAENVPYFTYRIGQLTDSAGAPITACGKAAYADTYVAWRAPRWALNPPDFVFYDSSGGLVTPPLTWASFNWDAAALSKIARIEYSRNASRPGETSFQTGIKLPTLSFSPSYG